MCAIITRKSGAAIRRRRAVFTRVSSVIVSAGPCANWTVCGADGICAVRMLLSGLVIDFLENPPSGGREIDSDEHCATELRLHDVCGSLLAHYYYYDMRKTERRLYL